jgi:versiconal hemiacetal acetate esterase
MYIAEEWLNLEKDVLGQRPLISGSVDEVRAAYQETSESLAQLYPAIDSYEVVDRECLPGKLHYLLTWLNPCYIDKEVTDSGIAIRVYTPAKTEPGAKLPLGVLFVHPFQQLKLDFLHHG